MKKAVNKFRFSPNFNQADRIDWHLWCKDAFDKAQEENKPVLLALSAVWCYWCHIMDETSYSDNDVIDYINEHFVAVRGDSDHRPDINARYNVGGWPTTAFLTGHGGFIGGATYLPPDQFLAMLGEVREAYQEDRPNVYEHARDMLRLRKEQLARIDAGSEINESLVNRAARTVAGAYDVFNGGFGDQPKFPNAPILGLLIHLTRTTGEDFYQVMVRKTLDRMADSGIWDREEGGFFRHCAKADWSDVQWEKLLEENLSLARVYMEAGHLFDNPRYLDVADRTVDYLLNHLLDETVPAIHGSQGAHSEYFNLPLSDRKGQPPALVDPSCYFAANAQAVSMLLDASWMLNRPSLRPLALELLEALDDAAENGRFSHVYYPSESVDVPAFLVDWAQLLNALLSAHRHTAQEGYLERAKKVALGMVDRFLDQDHGGFFDIETDPQAVGYLQGREKPLADNVISAMGLLKLSHATQTKDYRTLAEAILSAFAKTYLEHGELVGAYGLVVDLWLNPPLEISIEGDPGEGSTLKMLKAAGVLQYPHLAISLLPVQRFQPPAIAHICLDTVCLPPVSEPDELAGTVSGMLSDKAGHIKDIFQRFPVL